MTFAEAVKEMKQGKKLHRKSWATKDYIEAVKYIKFITYDEKEHVAENINIRNLMPHEQIALYSNGKYVVGSTLSTEDEIANDWVVM